VTVVALIGILAAIALPNYRVAIQGSREAVLKENLFRMREVIDQYYVDKGQYPSSLDALVEGGYLRKVPEDPITRAADWTPVYAEPDPDRPGEPPGGWDVKSASEEVSLQGTPYNEW
jgi:general secretion pathway protein G